MHPNSNGHVAIEVEVGDQELELERYGEGYAWLRAGIDVGAREYVLTEQGRAELDEVRREDAVRQLFGPWPTVAEASR